MFYKVSVVFILGSGGTETFGNMQYACLPFRNKLGVDEPY